MDLVDYPVVSQRSLAGVPRRGPLGMGRRSRTANDVPDITAEQVRVYRVGSQFRLDDGQYSLDSEEVIDASHVSVVDVRANRSLPVPITLVSAEGTDFHVIVTFACTVMEPVTVVRRGILVAQSHLMDYIKSHRRLFVLGANRTLDQIEDVRRDVDAQVQALVTVTPPEIDGLIVRLLSTEVLTPVEWSEWARDQAKISRGADLESHRIRTGRDVQVERDAAAELTTRLKKLGDLKLDDIVQQRRLEQLTRVRESVTTSSDAVLLGYLDGDRTNADYAQALAGREQLDREDSRRARELESFAESQRQIGRVEVLRVLAELGVLDTLEVDAVRLLNEIAFGELPTVARPAVAASVPASDTSTDTSASAREEDD